MQNADALDRREQDVDILKTHVVLDDEDEREKHAEEAEPESKVQSEVPSLEYKFHNQKMEEGQAKSENMSSSSGSDILQNIE